MAVKAALPSELRMKPLVSCLLTATLAGLAMQASADDSVNRATPTKHQMMKECLEKQKTADVTMSKSEMTRICKEEIKKEQSAGVAPLPPSDTPHDN
jgi:hypothetical protein